MAKAALVSMLAVLSTAVLAQQPTRQALQLQTVGVFALLGDSVQVAAAQAPTDTRLDRTERETLAFKGIAFDHIALKAATEHLRAAHPSTQLHLFQAPGGLTLDAQRAVAAGAENAELPAWMVRAIEEKRLTQLLIITRTRGALDARTAQNEGLGRATVEGIGFYLDRVYEMRNAETGAMSNGLIAPYLQIRLTLMDVRSGDVVARQDVRDAYAHAARASQVQGDPWTFMSTEEKVSTLRDMVAKGMARGLKELFKPL